MFTTDLRMKEVISASGSETFLDKPTAEVSPCKVGLSQHSTSLIALYPEWSFIVQIWVAQWHPTPVLLFGKSHGRRSLVGCSPWGREESDTTKQLNFHFSLSCTGEGNGNPLQCSCLENPRDGGAWWAAVYGVAQSRTRLKQLSSSSSSLKEHWKPPTVKIEISQRS